MLLWWYIQKKWDEVWWGVCFETSTIWQQWWGYLFSSIFGWQLVLCWIFPFLSLYVSCREAVFPPISNAISIRLITHHNFWIQMTSRIATIPCYIREWNEKLQRKTHAEMIVQLCAQPDKLPKGKLSVYLITNRTINKIKSMLLQSNEDCKHNQLTTTIKMS